MAGGERIPNAKRGYHDNHAAEMLVSRQTKKKNSKVYSDEFSSLQNRPRHPLPSPHTSSLCPSPTSTSPTSSCLTLGFWLSPDQTPVNNTGQVTPSRLAFVIFFFSVRLTFCCSLFSPFCCACIPCTLSLLKHYKGLRFCSVFQF